MSRRRGRGTMRGRSIPRRRTWPISCIARRPVRARRAPRGQAADQGHPARRREHLHRGPVPGHRERGAGGERRGQAGRRRLHDDDGDDDARRARRAALLAGRPAAPEVPPARGCRPGAALPAVHARTAIRTSSHASTWGSRGRPPSWSTTRGRAGGRRQGPTTGSTEPSSPRSSRSAASWRRPASRPRSWRSCCSAGSAPRPSTTGAGHRADAGVGASSSTRAVRRSTVNADEDTLVWDERPGVRAVAVVRARPPVRPARPRRRAAVHGPRPRAAQPVRQRPGPRRGPDAGRRQAPGGDARRCRSTSPAASSPRWTPSGIGDGDAPADLFDRTFNGRVAEIEASRRPRVGVRRAGPPPPPGAHLRRRPPRAAQRGVPPPDRPCAGPVRGRPRRDRAPVPQAVPHPAGDRARSTGRDRPGRALAAAPRQHG